MVEAHALRSTEPAPDWAAQPDDVLLRAVRTDATAMGPLYDRYARLVYGLARAVLQNDAEAEDLTQEVFMTLCEDHGYDPSRGTVGAYLTTVTRTRAIDRVRRRSRRVRLLHEQWVATPAPLSPTPADELSMAQCADRVRTAMAELSDNERRALEMAYFQGLSQVEIAEELDTPLGTVKSWCRRGLGSLKKSLGDLLE